jgi:hypothetical protein
MASITQAERTKAIRDHISQIQFPPNAQTLRARDLTWTQARDIMFGLANHQSFQLDNSFLSQFIVESNAADEIVVTPPPQPAAGSGTWSDGSGRFVVKPAVISRVQFFYVGNYNNTGDMLKPQRMTALPPLDPRFIVLLNWVCERLRSQWSVDSFYTSGVYGDPSTHGQNNCHNWGRAIDFAGVSGEVGWGKFEINVLKHWGMQPVTMPVDWGPMDATTKSRSFQMGREYPQWPDNFEDTTYRLELSNGTIESRLARISNWPEFGEYASRVFADLYGLLAIEAADTDNRNDDPTTIGRQSRNIIHPDHHSTKLRKDHKNHIHFQIGPTSNVGFWVN